MRALVLAGDLERPDQEQHEHEAGRRSSAIHDRGHGDDPRRGGRRSVEPVELVDLDALPGSERLGGPGPPELAVDEHEPALADDALHADDVLRADQHRLAPHRDRLRDRRRPRAPPITTVNATTSGIEVV